MKLIVTIILFTIFSSFELYVQNQSDLSLKVSNVSIKLSSAKTFLNTNPSFNQDIVFLINMKVPSGKNRFFIVDVKNKKVLDKGLVAHGFGKDGSVKFSNLSNSKMSSLGKCKIGISYPGKYGKSYKLYGLDKTNNNALSRGIVIHSHDEMPYDETNEEIIRSQGCPMVNKQFFSRLENILDTTTKPILLEIYY